VVSASALAACSGDEPVPATAQFTAMTRNVYVGADIEQVLLAGDLAAFLAAVDSQFKVVEATDFPARAKLLAAEIAAVDPDVIGLQEISLVRAQSPGDQVGGGTVLATDTVYDYLGSLLDELTAMGKTYQVAVKVENFDFEVTRGNATFDDIRLTDYDVILTRAGLTYANPRTANFETLLTVPLITGGFLEITRGWAAVDVTIDGVTYLVVNTHLESAAPGVRLAQGTDLIDSLSAETGPIILVGDLNTDAISGSDPTYGVFTNAGYQDLWGLTGTAQGLSCCHNSELSNTTSTFSSRIDFVMTRNITVLQASGDVEGEDAADRSGGLWPSDHGGVWAAATVEVPGN
jgi:endonuclease/exonuclease/phosphatase family metal-dependent hydrolase